jgi:gamma-glutamyltranspeptidase/glutathione hydrolase
MVTNGSRAEVGQVLVLADYITTAKRSMHISTGRPATLATRGMVTSPHALASAAGVDVLRAGGSAVDAAIATSAVLAVVYPHMTSIGGDAFWLIHEGRTGAIRYLNGGGKAAAGASIAELTARGIDEIALRGIVPATLTVPGALASWAEAHSAYGRIPLARSLDTAIGYAQDGFAVTERVAGWIADTRADLQQSPEAAAVFMPGGVPPRAGARIANPNLARTLRAFAQAGWSGFYEGEVADEFARYAADHGGFFQASDFKAQRATWGVPLSSRYRGVEIFNTPPPTQGFTVLQMLNILAPFELHRRDFLGPDHLHLLVQAKQLAYYDRDRALADPAFAPVPIERFLSPDYAAARAQVIDLKRALPWDQVPSFGSLAGDTVYIAVVDAQGNAVSLIQSLYGVFGSCMMAGTTGVMLQNRSAYFSLDPAHPNRLEPGKIPLHTLIASMAKREGKLWCVLGCMGADGQPQIQLQAYVGLIDFSLGIQDVLEMPRFLSGRFALGESRDTLHMEARFPAATIDELARRGHVVNRWGDWNELAGHAHGITIDPDNAVLAGGCDPRSDGAAVGW